ncbi:hypothetical protein D6833_12680 [Candidatus Parcubacteria bacterium]|nr:MAG: hypothetical protein D6833_12680 [Candidatus Parcubacteria bacterium]
MDSTPLLGAVQNPLQQLARDLLQAVTPVFRLAVSHGPENAVLARPIDRLLSLLEAGFSHSDHLALQIVGGRAFINQEVIRLDPTSFDHMERLHGLLSRFSLNEVAFLAPSTRDQILDLLAIFHSRWTAPDPLATIQNRAGTIRLRRLSPNDAALLLNSLDSKQLAVRAYAAFLVSLRQTLGNQTAGRALRPVHVRRALQNLADACSEQPFIVEALTRSPHLSDAPYRHQAVVATHVLLMSRRLSLPKNRLTAFALAAAFHDLAKDSTGSERHLDGFDCLQRLLAGPMGIPTIERAVAAAESRNPIVCDECDSPSVLARLIAVPCAFDLLTRPSTSRAPFPPERAMRLLVENSPHRFDARIISLFQATVGIYPVGSVVRLSTGSQAVVISVPKNMTILHRPVIKVISDGSMPDGHLVDLSEQPPSVYIVETLDPAQAGINTLPYLLA